MWAAEPVRRRLAVPDLPGVLDHEPDITRIVRRAGATIAPDGGPLTGAGYRRVQTWRQEWLALPGHVVPAVLGPDGTPHYGPGGLRYLAMLAGQSARPAPQPVAG